jgi:hypothetical protein
MHEVDIIRLAPGRGVEDARAWFKAESGPAPGILGGGVLDSHDLGRVTWIRCAFEPGRYLLWCDMPMIQTAEKPDPATEHIGHSDAGMFREFEVQ